MTMRSFIALVSAAGTQRLDEMWWGERYAAAKAIQKHPGCFVHFSNINKLGVNPSKQHRDPPGVYFYPGQWLFSDDASLHQYASTYAYYFIVKLRMDKNFINLGKLTKATMMRIAKANGWMEDLERLMADPELLKKIPNIGHNPKLLRKPGGLFYGAMDYLVNVEKKYRWLQLLRGVSGLYDPGFSIIAEGEAAQAVVFNASAIQIVEMGDNKDDLDRNLANAFKPVAEKFGGTFSYKRKIPTITIQREGLFVEVGYDWGSWRWISTYSKDGFLTVETDRDHSGSTGDADSYAGSMTYKLEAALKKADAVPVKHGPWNSVACMRLKSLIGYVGHTRQGVKDGTFEVAAFETSHFSRMVSITTADAQSVHVKAECYTKDWEAEFEQTFDGRATPEQVAHTMLTQLWAKVKPNLAVADDMEKVSKILGFRFDTVDPGEPSRSNAA